MFVVRPVAMSDMPALVTLAKSATRGVHALPGTRQAIEQAVERSIASFASPVGAPGDEAYLFVLEPADGNAIAGTATISAHARTSDTFFAFRNDVIQQVSRDLDISHSVHALTLCSYLTGHSRLSGFFMRDWRRAGAEAVLLSRARLLFAAIAPHRFGERFFASLAGIIDGNGCSPFWEALGRKFFQMDFLEAERLIDGARNRTLIVELMPHYPVYVPLLPAVARVALGQAHAEAELPFQILSGDGFESGDFIDIFDGGPILHAHKHALRSFSGSVRRQVAEWTTMDGAPAATYLVSSTKQENFRALIATCARIDLSDRIMLSPSAMRRLEVAPGDSVLCVSM